MDVLFVVMPFGPVLTPSLGVSLLQSHLHRSEISSKTHYATLSFAKVIGIDRYVRLQESGAGLLLGEYCFASLAFPDCFTNTFDSATLRYGDFFKNTSAQLREDACLAQKESGAMLEHVIDLANRLQPKIVICSSMFQQNLASIALFNALRACPSTNHIVTIMGGCNTEYSLGLGLLRRCKSLDYVCSGSGEETLPLLCKQLLSSIPALPLPKITIQGVYSQASLYHFTEVEPNLASMTRGRLEDLNASLPPDFNDYFDQLAFSGLEILPALPIESSRGCWWGEKSHCTFCGLNGDDLSFKHKHFSDIASLILELSGKHGVKDFTFVDNIIPLEYFETFLPLIEAYGLNLFYETKSNLSKHQIAQFKRSGVNHIQPGIESLLDDVLQLMRKGTTQLINLECLKFCAEYSIIPNWSILWNFPGENHHSYLEYLDLIPKIVHLHPPGGMVAIRFDKFSPYQLNPAEWGLELTPLDSYSFLYPSYRESLNDIAYFFRRSGQPYHPVPFSCPNMVSQNHPVYRDVYDLFSKWKGLWSDYDCVPRLEYQLMDSTVVVYDSRGGISTSTILSDFEYFALTLLETKCPLSFIAKECMSFNPGTNDQDIVKTLEAFIVRGWVVRSKKQYLSLILKRENCLYSLRTPSGSYEKILVHAA